MSKKSSRKFACCSLLFIGTLIVIACSGGAQLKIPEYSTLLSPDETKLSAFKELFPEQFALYERNNLSGVDTMTEYGGAVNFDKNNSQSPLPEGYRNAQPYLKALWLGYPFSYEYRAARGHSLAVRDILHIDRINRYGDGKGQLPATCWTCKTPNIPRWVKEQSDEKFWSSEFNRYRTAQAIDMKDESINCANCHDPKTMELRIISTALPAALKRRDPNWSWEKTSRNEKRTLVCAQCHVEYYFTPANQGIAAKPEYPWDKGRDPVQIYEYYNSHGPATAPKGFEGKFYDWIHPVSQTPMIKVQHPEFETWYDGPHGAAGVSCSDCHMPYTREDGKKKVSSHHWHSPLKNIETACRQCHADKSADYLKSRVEYTQKKTFEQLLKAQEHSVRAHEAVRLAAEFGGAKGANYDALMIEARENVRKGQFYWDFVSAENSVGFHNPAKALETLLLSIETSDAAVSLATQATGGGISKALAGDIQTLVPPIRNHSRKLQQSAAHLASHPWLKYLPMLPESEQVWDEQKWVGKEPEPKF